MSDTVLQQAHRLAAVWQHHGASTRVHWHTRTAVTGAQAQRRSGDGSQFWQYRPLTAGEPHTRIDWRQSARTDNHYVRETELSKTRTHLIWCDTQASMQVPAHKQTTAQVIGLAIMIAAKARGQKPVFACGAHLCKTTDDAARSEPVDGTPLPDLKPLDQVTIISDFFNDTPHVLIDQLTHRACPVMLVQTLTRQEQSFAFNGHVRLEAPAHAPYVSPAMEQVQVAYLDKLNALQTTLASTAKRHDWAYAVQTTDDNPTRNHALADAVRQAL